MTTTPSFEQMKAQVRKDWTDNSVAWRKWNAKFVVQTAEATKLIANAAELSQGLRVLDLASGTGEPALSIARIVGPNGHVTATDLVPEMLAAIRDNAKKQRLENMTVEPADIEELQYGDASFDRITSRFGVMFCPNAPRAFRQIRRVLKPGGRVAFMVWASPTQPLMEAMVGNFAKRAKLPPQPPGAPTPFRYAESGSLSAIMNEVGFRDVKEEPHTIAWNWPGPPDELFQAQREIVPQLYMRFEAALSKEEFAAAAEESLAAFRRGEVGGETRFDVQVHVATATR